MGELVAVGVPLALVIRLTSVVATLMLARHARVCRWVAIGGSIAASVVTAGIAVRVIGSASAIDGTLAHHAAFLRRCALPWGCFPGSCSAPSKG
jgi:hypothetical protein